MQDLIFAFLIAFVVAWIMTPVCIRLAYKVGAIDIPKDENGAYKIDTSAEGVYKIVYTVDSLKYKNIERIRVFRVVGGEEIG